MKKRNFSYSTWRHCFHQMAIAQMADPNHLHQTEVPFKLVTPIEVAQEIHNNVNPKNNTMSVKIIKKSGSYANVFI